MRKWVGSQRVCGGLEEEGISLPVGQRVLVKAGLIEVAVSGANLDHDVTSVIDSGIDSDTDGLTRSEGCLDCRNFVLDKQIPNRILMWVSTDVWVLFQAVDKAIASGSSVLIPLAKYKNPGFGRLQEHVAMAMGDHQGKQACLQHP